MNCTNCGSALPLNSDICDFCKTRNDTDLRNFDALPGEISDRNCPRCERAALQTITISLGGALHVDRCRDCLGIFFDRHELERFLDRALDQAHEVDYQRLQQLAEETGGEKHPVAYVACPVCAELMHRRAYGKRSGVIVDTCREHGVWLDGGELGSLMRWARLGGQALEEQGPITELLTPRARAELPAEVAAEAEALFRAERLQEAEERDPVAELFRFLGRVLRGG